MKKYSISIVMVVMASMVISLPVFAQGSTSDEFARAVQKYSQERDLLSSKEISTQSFEQRKSFLTAAFMLLQARLNQLETFSKSWDTEKEEGAVLKEQIKLNQSTLLGVKELLEKSKTTEDLQKIARVLYTYRIVQEQTLNKAILTGYVERLDAEVLTKAKSRLVEFSKGVVELDKNGAPVSELKELILKAEKEEKQARSTLDELRGVVIMDISVESIKKIEQGINNIQTNVDALYASLKQVALKGKELYKKEFPKAE